MSEPEVTVLYHPGTGAEYRSRDAVEVTRLRAHGYRLTPPTPEDEVDVGPQDVHTPTPQARPRRTGAQEVAQPAVEQAP